MDGRNDAPPLVSIVIPSYNHGRYLEATIESVLGQDYPRVELIVIDDGSTDNSREILGRYGGRFHWESQPNQGQGVTLNRGWLMSRGEILAWIGADDVLMPEAASTSVRHFMANPDAVLTYCDFDLIDGDSRFIRRMKAAEFNYRDMVVKQSCPPGPGAFFRRSAFEAVGPWDDTLRIMLDYDYWLRLGLRGRFVRIPQVLARYRLHSGQETFSQMDATKAAEPVRIVSRLYETHALPPELAKVKDEALSNAHLVSAQLHFRGGRYRLGSGSLRRALTLCPKNLFTLRTLRLAANVLLNRPVYKLIWKINSLRKR